MTGVLGFVVVVALAPFVGPGLIGDDGTGLIVLFALTLLAATVDDTSMAILRLLDRFKTVTLYTTATEMLRLALVIVALVVWETLAAVLAAMVVAKAITAVVTFTVTRRTFGQLTGGAPLMRAGRPAVAREDRRTLFGMLLHTNVLSYGKLAQVQLPPLILGAMAGPTQAALYKLGLAASAILGKLIDPGFDRHHAAARAPVGRLRHPARAPARAPHDHDHRSDDAHRGRAAAAVRWPRAAGARRQAGQGRRGRLRARADRAGGLRARVLAQQRARRRGTVAGALRVTVVAAVVQVALVFALVPSMDATGAAVAYLVSSLLLNGVLGSSPVRTLKSSTGAGSAAAPTLAAPVPE